MDTRTPRPPDPSGRPPGDTPKKDHGGFFNDEPALNRVRVPSDPAEVVVTHASFRVELAPPSDVRTPASAASVEARGEGSVLWGADRAGSGAQAQPWRTASHGRGADVAEPAGATTQVLPRVEEDTGPMRVPDGTGGSPTVVSPRSPRSPRHAERTQQQPEHAQRLLHGVRPARGAFDDLESGDGGGRTAGSAGHGNDRDFETSAFEAGAFGGADFGGADYDGADYEHAGAEGVRRQAYYPGRRMNLGVVLLPMRIFLGFISVYAGMGKLCDPVYFDGDERGSMVTWLHALDPWALASPLHGFALAHPVGSGLTVAFVQIIIGVLTVCGLWQRVAASVGALLSAALLMTVSWSSGPAYEAPDIIYLAAWSPLIIAGAPVYSVDGRLATDAWRKLGPRADLWQLRRRVLRRGTVMASVIAGLALLTGSMLGAAVRSSQTAEVPTPGEPPTNRVPGSPLRESPGGRTDSGRPTPGQQARGADGTKGPGSDGPSASASPGERGAGDDSVPSQRETVQAPQQTDPGAQPPQQSDLGTQSTRGGSASTGGGGGSNSGGGSGGSDSGGSGGGSSSGGNGGGLGGLLG